MKKRLDTNRGLNEKIPCVNSSRLISVLSPPLRLYGNLVNGSYLITS